MLGLIAIIFSVLSVLCAIGCVCVTVLGVQGIKRRVRAKVAREIAYDIRAELVCCEVYDQDADTDRAGTRHEICFWGEAGARLAEDHVHKDWEARRHEVYKTATGKELGPEEIEGLAAEAEAGYDVDQLRPRQRGEVSDD